MRIYSYSAVGFDGELVIVEVDIRRGIPGIEIVGLPDGAVRESRERVRVAIRNSGFCFPTERILVNLAPAGLRKEGAAFDLAVALGILRESGQLESGDGDILVMGELELTGRVRRVRSVLSAVDSGLSRGIADFLLPLDNIGEASVLRRGNLCGIGHLRETVGLFTEFSRTGMIPRIGSAVVASPDGVSPATGDGQCVPSQSESAGGERTYPDYLDIRGQEVVKRALEVAAAGGHHVFLFGPPGCGKTMAAMRFPGLLPPLEREDAVTVTRIYSNAGLLPKGAGLIRTPPFRTPHHSSSLEGLIGGGKSVRPGEVSLSHRGVLFLDEAPEFKRNILQSLREPIEEGRVIISRAGASFWFPSDFQLILAANPCPCGNLGWDDRVCLCSAAEVASYWKRLQGPLLDRVDIRIPVHPVPPGNLLKAGGESTDRMRERVLGAMEVQKTRFRTLPGLRNSKIPASLLDRYCPLDDRVRNAFESAAKQLSLSSRAMHSVVRIARTVADLERSEDIGLDHIYEAVQHRRYGDGDFCRNSA